MLLRGQEWGPVFNSSGARGFFGEGYWFHKPWKKLGLDYTGSDFVAKTTTWKAREGNMPLKEDGTTPRQLIPKCIVVKPIKGVVLNSVGLSGPGAVPLFKVWRTMIDDRLERLMISFMPVEEGKMERIDEMFQFIRQVVDLSRAVPGKLAVQLNFSCPNVGANLDHVLHEMDRFLWMFQTVKNVPVLVKVAATMDPEAIKEVVENHRVCDGVICSNTIPWGQLPDDIDWVDLFGSDVSPLWHLGGGGLSGKPLRPLVREWIQEARRVGLTKPIVACGGILSVYDADEMLDAGADGIELGSVSILRPWRVQRIIRHVNTRLG